MFDGIRSLITTFAPVASDIAAVITTVIGILIFREARSIRQTNWRSKSNERWTNFNDLVLRYDYAERWGEIINGRVDWKDITQKDKMVIYSFLNVLSHQYNLANIRLMPWRYVDKSVGDNIMYFSHIWDDLIAHLRKDGWSTGFLDTLERHVQKVREAQSEPEILPRRRFIGLP